MAITLANLLVKVEADTGTLNSDLKKAERRAQSFGGRIGKTTKEVGKFAAAHAATIAAMKGLEKTMRSTGGELTKLNSSIATVTGAVASFGGGIKRVARLIVGRLLPGIGILLGAAGLIGLTKALTRFGESAANVAPVSNAFENLAVHVGTTGETLRQRLRSATQGAVSDLDLMKSSVVALNSEVIESPELLAELASHARTLGRTVGMETTDALDDMIRGIGLMNPQLLKNLGVLVSVDEATREWAEANDRSVSSLTDHERHAAFLAAALEEIRGASERVGDTTDDLGTLLAQAEASGENFRQSMKRAVAESEGIRGVNEDWSVFRRTLNELGNDTLPSLLRGLSDIVGVTTRLFVTGIPRIFIQSFEEWRDVNWETVAAMNTAEAHADRYRITLSEVEDAAQKAGSEIAGFNREVSEGPEISLPEGFGERGDLPSVDELRNRAREGLMAALDEVRDFNDAMDEALGDGFDGIEANISATRQAVEDLIRFGFDPASEAVRELVAELNRLELSQNLQAFLSGPQNLRSGLGRPTTTRGMPGRVGATGIRPINFGLGGGPGGGIGGEDLEAIDQAVRGVASLADASGELSGEARDAVRGLSDIIGGLQGLKGGGGLLSQIAGGAGLAGGVVSVFSGLLSATEENTKALRDSTASFTERLELTRRMLDLRDADPAARFQALNEELQRAVRSGFEQGGVRQGEFFQELMSLTPGNIGEFFADLIEQSLANEIQLEEFLELIGFTPDEFFDLVGEMERLGDETAGAADSMQRFNEQMRNVPSGFKVALRRFQATVPEPRDDGGGLDVIVVKSTVNLDGEVVGESVEQQLLRKAQRGGTTSTFLFGDSMN